MRGLVPVLLLGVAPIALQGKEVDGGASGREAQGPRYSPASEITRTNVNRLAVAWTYRTGETDPRFKTEKPTAFRSEEHTSELQSQSNLVCRLLLEKKKKNVAVTHSAVQSTTKPFVI